MNDTPRRLALDNLHRELDARMSSFAGFQMPIQYPAGLRAEHLHTRASASLFDVSHMGQLRVTSPEGEAALHAGLEAALPLDFEAWPDGLQRYTLLLTDSGGIADDLMAIRLPGEVRLVVNAGNREADLVRLRALCPTLDFEWIDAALFALQGPRAEEVLASFDASAAQLPFMHAAELTIDGVRCLTTRSGYTGEDGFEISVPAQAEAIARRLLAHPAVAPAGLGARDTLRLEAGLALHGNDIGPDVLPAEARIGFAIAASRRPGAAKAGGFPGAAALEAAGKPSRQLVGLVSSESIPVRAGSAIVDADENELGVVTSGTVSPSLGHPIMLAMVAREALAREGLRARVRERRPEVRIVSLPFVPKQYKRN
ncbi:MAG: glycine cleavage system aminomethyltransferase GcvT [Burkholderiaceae bacterium]